MERVFPTAIQQRVKWDRGGGVVGYFEAAADASYSSERKPVLADALLKCTASSWLSSSMRHRRRSVPEQVSRPPSAADFTKERFILRR
ncbi:unnamed protein product [Nippostrongylus brasiliensis]|uniref:Uncharacterized protein n=1 Tax=Nippostrongylus brasiliensis TaxID=27835 RepID=A0A0N4Y7B2_NIPBR|nr:hypothetical protein Q1695_008816 [Nippostrongylus brasiliensis]VDL75627.1 unnamed protein product [Nippostrongylus brasiliensis]